MSLRGRECGPCGRVGHACPATVMGDVGDGDEPLCLDCLEERPCVRARIQNRGRETSAARLDLNVYGEEVTATASAVIERTPEELGIPRLVEDEAPGALMPWIDRSVVIRVRAAREHAASAHERAQHERLRALEREIEEQPAAGPGDEPEQGEGMGRGRAISEETVAAIKAAPNESAAKLARRLEIEPHVVFYYRAKFKKEAGTQRVVVDAKQPGTAVALERALAKADARVQLQVAAAEPVRVEANPAATVTLQLTMTEAQGLLAKLTEGQRSAFFAAGLRAALLAE